MASPPHERADLSDLLSQLGDETAPASGEDLTDPRDVSRPERASAAVIESAGGLDFNPDFASIGSRFVGFAIDSVLTTLLALPGIALLVTSDSASMKILGALLAVAGVVVASILYARSVSRSGQWLGNRVAGTKVVDVQNGSMLTGSNAAARFLTRQLLGVFIFPFVMALTDSQRRTFHDHLASSVVTRPTRETWSINDSSA